MTFPHRLAAALLLAPLSISHFHSLSAQDTTESAKPKAERVPIVVSPRAIEIHRSAPVVDGHNDLPYALKNVGGRFAEHDIAGSAPEFDTDIPRLRKGGVGAQFWSVYVSASTMQDGIALSSTLEQIAIVKRMIQRYPDVFELALNSQDVDRIREQGKIASMIGVEGGHSIENSLNVLRQLHAQGARYMTLTHSISLDWADSCSDKVKSGGLSAFGEEVVREMNRLGMMVDLSHVSADCMRHALRVTKAPVIFSHSSVFAIAPHARNVPNDVLKLTRDNGGVVMINFFPDFVHPTDTQRSLKRTAMRQTLEKKYPDDSGRVDAEIGKWERIHPRSKLCTVHDVLDHIDHVVNIAGIDHVGIGSDFDGVPALPQQLDDVSAYPVITQGLLDRGYDESQIRKVLGGNIMRVFRQAERVSKSMN